jgi:hypothetical protein
MLFLIDGHNLIGQTPGLRLDDPDDEQKLVELLRAHLVHLNKKGVVFFDRGEPGGATKWSNNVLQVRFARPPKTADAMILERLRQERDPRGVIVVTSDQAVKRAAQRTGANVKSSRQFAQEMRTPSARPKQKESGLSTTEVEAWEKEFMERGRGKK